MVWTAVMTAPRATPIPNQAVPSPKMVAIRKVFVIQ
jgi:hypothetical protein